MMLIRMWPLFRPNKQHDKYKRKFNQQKEAKTKLK